MQCPVAGRPHFSVLCTLLLKCAIIPFLFFHPSPSSLTFAQSVPLSYHPCAQSSWVTRRNQRICSEMSITIKAALGEKERERREGRTDRQRIHCRGQCYLKDNRRYWDGSKFEKHRDLPVVLLYSEPKLLPPDINLNFRYILHSAAQFLPPHMSSGRRRKVLDNNPPNDEDGSCRPMGRKAAYYHI